MRLIYRVGRFRDQVLPYCDKRQSVREHSFFYFARSVAYICPCRDNLV